LALEKRAVHYDSLDLRKMEWLARHDGTSTADQFRMAIRRYLTLRKKTVYPIRGEDPLNDGFAPSSDPSEGQSQGEEQ